MARKKKKYHYLYKTTNILTKRYYYGMHSTNNLDDGYQGSGKRLRYSINKYGKDNHKREIIEFCPDRSSLIKKEIELVNLNEIAKKDCMNLKVGGEGEMPNNIDHSKGGKVGGNIHAIRLKEDIEYAKKHKKNFNKMLKRVRLTRKLGCDWTNRKHTDEEKRKMSIKASMRVGKKNSQFGTCWITNCIENKKIKKRKKIPNGWKLGRKLKVN